MDLIIATLMRAIKVRGLTSLSLVAVVHYCYADESNMCGWLTSLSLVAVVDYCYADESNIGAWTHLVVAGCCRSLLLRWWEQLRCVDSPDCQLFLFLVVLGLTWAYLLPFPVVEYIITMHSFAYLIGWAVLYIEHRRTGPWVEKVAGHPLRRSWKQGPSN